MVLQILVETDRIDYGENLEDGTGVEIIQFASA